MSPSRRAPTDEPTTNQWSESHYGGLAEPVNSLPLRVLIAEAQPLVRDGLSHSLGIPRQLAVVGETGSSGEAIDLLIKLRPDVVIVGHAPPLLDATRLVIEVHDRHVSSRFLILANERDVVLARRTVASGVAGWLSRDLTGEQVTAAVFACGLVGVILDDGLARAIATEAGGRRADMDMSARGGILSSREREVVQLLAGDYSASAIAENLFLSTSTVRTHLARIYRKLSVSSAAGAVAEGLRRGLIE